MAKDERADETEMAAYYQALGLSIERAKRYPRSALRRRQQGTVKLRLRIAADGSLLRAEIASPARHRALNEAALQLAYDSSPFPEPPPGAAAPVEVVVPVKYTLR